MLPVIVPQEIVEDIVEKLRGDPRTLHSCSLVSWSFRTASQQLLFHHILLDVRKMGHSQRFHCVLSKNPTLASYIRSIHLEIDDMSLIPEVTICRILDMAKPHVRELSIDDSGTTGSAGGWVYMHSDLQNSLLSIIASPSCMSLTLGAVGFPIKYLRLFSHIRHLKLNSHSSVTVGGACNAYILEDQPRRQGYLETLSAVSFPLECLLEYLGDSNLPSSLSLSRLRILATTLMQQCTFSFEMILHLSEGYLEEVDVSIHLDLSKEPITFSRLSHLRTLRIEIQVRQPAHCIAMVLATIPPTTVELALKMPWEIATSIGRKEWLDIETLLLEKCDKSSGLRSVVMDLTGWGSGRFLARRMPRLVERGIVIIRLPVGN
ncbi:hypothetical protein FPV67DRAFT_1502810 [Lyophyllum atratum]|nr:hypothetical protein FPV67DRAFT_1502810 [Lyophyllum atratum]